MRIGFLTDPAVSLRDRIAAWRDSRRYDWPHRLLFVAALPKSGSQWMKSMMLRIPGYREALMADPQGLLSRHHIDLAMLESIPARGYFTVNYPAEATDGLLRAVQVLDLRVVVMWRDLRDQVVSRYYHVLNDPWHPSHARYNAQPRKQAISDSVGVVLEEFQRWVRDWRAAMAREPGRYHLVRYEDLRADPNAAFSGVLSFYGIELGEQGCRDIVEAATARTRSGNNLAERISQGSTFRSGKTGEWRSHFSPADVRRFKDEGGELLIELGYERDLDW